jgi:hypothetical protein
MSPKLKYFLTARNVITDSDTKEPSALGVFEVIILPATLDTYVYSFFVLGRIELGMTGIVNSSVRVVLFDPTGKELRSELVKGSGLNAAYGINFPVGFYYIPFSLVGKYALEVSVNVNDGEFVKLGEPYHFDVVRLNATQDGRQ